MGRKPERCFFSEQEEYYLLGNCMSRLPTELLWVFNTPQWWRHPALSVPQSLMQMRPLLGDDNYPVSWRQTALPAETLTSLKCAASGEQKRERGSAAAKPTWRVQSSRCSAFTSTAVLDGSGRLWQWWSLTGFRHAANRGDWSSIKHLHSLQASCRRWNVRTLRMC